MYISYYLLTITDLFDRYFYCFTFFVAMKSELCASLASKIGDFTSEYDTELKQGQLLNRITLLHQSIYRYTSFVLSFLLYKIMSISHIP